MSNLVERLADGKHKITVGGPNPSCESLKAAIDRQYVHVKFTETQGGSDLGIRLDVAACVVQNADFEKEQGTLHLEGTLTLDYVPVRCVADFDLATLNGEGQLQVVAHSQGESKNP